jgi:hypothetical protein
MSRLYTTIALSALSFFAFSAHAMNSVNNLDDQPHTLAIRSIGGATRTLEIPPSESVRFNEYRAEVFLVGQEDRVQPSRMGDQFVIWKDGTLRLQRRQYQRFND